MVVYLCTQCRYEPLCNYKVQTPFSDVNTNCTPLSWQFNLESTIVNDIMFSKLAMSLQMQMIHHRSTVIENWLYHSASPDQCCTHQIHNSGRRTPSQRSAVGSGRSCWEAEEEKEDEFQESWSVVGSGVSICPAMFGTGRWWLWNPEEIQNTNFEIKGRKKRKKQASPRILSKMIYIYGHQVWMVG